MSASNHNKPAAVGRDGIMVMDESIFYPGAIVNAKINVYPYDRATGKGIAFGLEGVQFVRDGDRLDTQQDPNSMFGALGDDAGAGGFDPLA